jgi:hypothetical protein
MKRKPVAVAVSMMITPPRFEPLSSGAVRLYSELHDGGSIALSHLNVDTGLLSARHSDGRILVGNFDGWLGCYDRHGCCIAPEAARLPRLLDLLGVQSKDSNPHHVYEPRLLPSEGWRAYFGRASADAYSCTPQAHTASGQRVRLFFESVFDLGHTEMDNSLECDIELHLVHTAAIAEVAAAAAAVGTVFQ